MRTGLAVGKFWPPHSGHSFLIECVAERCDRMVVVVCATPSQVPNGGERAIWLQALFPRAEVVVVDDACAAHHPDPCSETCSGVWAARIADLGVGTIDLVGTSESYGERFARLMGAEHLSVDPDRVRVRVSSTDVRRDLSGSWHQLPRVVKVGLTRRVVIVGAESTGTSTLARDLAEALESPCTAEAGRTVSWELFARAGNDMGNITWTEEIFWDIVNKQIALEQHAYEQAIRRVPGGLGPWIVCDTDTLATIAWWERYLGTESGSLQRFASVRPADLYLLTDPVGVQFDDADPLRDGAAIRSGMHERFARLLEASDRPWRLVSGSPTERLEIAVRAVEEHEGRHPRWVHR